MRCRIFFRPDNLRLIQRKRSGENIRHRLSTPWRGRNDPLSWSRRGPSGKGEAWTADHGDPFPRATALGKKCGAGSGGRADRSFFFALSALRSPPVLRKSPSPYQSGKSKRRLKIKIRTARRCYAWSKADPAVLGHEFETPATSRDKNLTRARLQRHFRLRRPSATSCYVRVPRLTAYPSGFVSKLFNRN